MKQFAFLLFILCLPFASSAQSVLSFDGVNDYISLGTNSGNNVRTVELWFKLDNPISTNLNSFKILCSREVSSANRNEWHLSFTPTGTRIPSGTMRFAVVSSVGNAAEVISNNRSWNANQWYHVAAVIHPTQGMMLFIDGVKQNSTQANYTSATASMSEPLEIGRQRGFSRYFHGKIEDFHLSSTALYTSNFSPPCPDRLASNGTIGLWNFNQQSGNIAYDSGPLANDVTIHGASWDTSFVCSKGQTSLAFDGVNNYLDLGSNAANNVRTIEFWFKLNRPITSSLSSAKVICSREVSSANTNEWHISFHPTGTIINAPGVLRFALVQSVGNTKEVHSNSNNWNANQWYHVAAVIHPYQGMMLFIDGVKQNSTLPNDTTATASMNSPLELGRQRGFSSRYFEGNIEDFHLSTTALYSNNFTPPCPGITPGTGTLGLWNFNENVGTIAHDASPLQNDVAINGASWDSSFVCNNQTVGIEEASSTMDTKEEVVVYPNPSQGLLFISDATDISRISIFSLEGKLISEFKQLENNRIELPELSGFYLVRIQKTSGEIIQRKVIRQ